MQEAPVEIPTPHQIPEPPATFVGRRDELAELTAAIREGGAVISGLRGLGGIGKTALAYKLAQELADDYPDAQLLVDLDGTSESPLAPEQAMAQAIHAFHPRLDLPSDQGQLAGLYRSILHEKRALLLLDDAASAEEVEPLIPPSCCGLLVTSRRRFQLPGMYPLDLDALDREAAIELLCSIAPRIGHCAGEIAELCGRLPLALQVAASALAERVDIAPTEYLRRLKEKGARFDEVDASLSLSYDLLGEELQRLWARLGVFTIGFDRETAEAVWDMDAETASDRLGDLLRYSLIDWQEETGRYRLHDLARAFAYDRLKELEGDPRPIHRLAAQYLHDKISDPERGGTPQEGLEEVDQWERAEAWEQFAQRASALVGSLEIKERLGDVHGMAQTWGNLGDIYRRQGDLGELGEFAVGEEAELLTLSGETMYDQNTLEEPERIVPQTSSAPVTAGTLSLTLSPYSLARVRVALG